MLGAALSWSRLSSAGPLDRQHERARATSAPRLPNSPPISLVGLGWATAHRPSGHLDASEATRRPGRSWRRPGCRIGSAWSAVPAGGRRAVSLWAGLGDGGAGGQGVSATADPVGPLPPGAARRACIDHWGHVCVVCGIDFGKTYGRFAKGFIHVHHLRELSTCLLYTSPSPRDRTRSRMPSSA